MNMNECRYVGDPGKKTYFARRQNIVMVMLTAAGMHKDIIIIMLFVSLH